MTLDDLSKPLGQQREQRRWPIPITIAQVFAGALSLFLGVFVVWAIVANDPFGGEPIAVVPAELHPATTAKVADAQKQPDAAGGTTGISPDDGPIAQNLPSRAAPGSAPAAAPAPTANTRTITIIDGKTGQRQEVVIPAPANEAVGPPATNGPPLDAKFVEMTARGAIPKIASDGVQPAEAFARPVKPLPGKPDAPRVAIIVEGLGVSGRATSDAIAKLPGPVTLGFMPYGTDVAALVARARGGGHEILLQVPMEPFDYPDNDPGPQTLLTTLAPEQNIDRLYWLMSRFGGYVGLTNAMGARFTASEESFAPVLRETAKRGLIFVDDGSNPRSIAGQIAGANNMAFAKADVILDSVPTPDEIDRALGLLEMSAREHGVAVGVASALPVSIDHIAKWAKAAESRGLLLVPITAVALKAKQT